MTLLGRLRRKQNRHARRAAAGALLVWCTLVLQPCVMALETGHEGDCPHCPPKTMAHHEGHDTASQPCAASAECSALDEIDYDGRDPQSKVERPPLTLAALIPIADIAPTAGPPGLARSSPARDHLPGASPPLHVTYCVYLD